ncbi:MAG: mucoidy inhibitor MuiA family protein [Hyphomicrobiales bacterium]|nr:mucoidy inhibitor MuiA family protein [Hyphomicrobiales bacterium]MBV9427218.1 mucoidy inhibitor MuiA family protein [Bradyrhizobiaceae bacterium]
MRGLPMIVLALLAAAPAAAGEIEVGSTIDAVTVYPDGATVTRVIRVDLPQGDSTLISRDFPPGLDPASLRVEGETSARVVIGAIDARTPRPERPADAPEIEKRIEALRDQLAVLNDDIAAQSARKSFVQRYAEQAPVAGGEKGVTRPVAEWREAFSAVAEEISAADGSIRESKLKQRGIERELARLNAQIPANPARKQEVRIDLAAEAAAAARLRVSYTVRGARWVPLYDARLDSGGRDGKPALELVRRAEIVQQTGEDWTNVALSVSTVRTAKGGNAPELRPILVRFEAPVILGGHATQSDRVAQSPAPPAGESALRQRENVSFADAALAADGIQATFRIPGRIGIAADAGAKSFRIAAAALTPDLLVRTAPALETTAYLQASFKHGEDAPLLPGRVSLYRDGIYVGRGDMPGAAKEEMVRLGFGADDRVKVVRAVVRRNEGSAGLISSSKTDEREFKITVRNGHDAPVRVAVEDRLPVSEVAEVTVELLPATTPPTERDAGDRRGVLAWTFDAAPAELHEIKLAWRVRWPADKAVVFDGGRP